MRWTRRRLLTSIAAASLVTATSSCSNSERDTEPGSALSPSPTAGDGPTQVVHRYGTTTITAAPRRIVSLGQTDHDPLVALGSMPIAVGSFIDDDYRPVRPWNSQYFPREPIRLNMQELEFEKIASLNPDLILAVMSGITRGDYTKLSAIAPTVAQPRDYGDWAVPYRPHTEHVGAAIGRRSQAAALVADLDARFAAARAANPTLAGKTAICVEWWAPDFYVLGSAAPRNQFLTDLGMTLPPELITLVGSEYNAPLSNEKLDLLDDLDVVVWTAETGQEPALLGNKLVASLRTTREGRSVLAPTGGADDLLYSMDWGTVLSNGWAIEHAVPALVAALDGDPATKSTR